MAPVSNDGNSTPIMNNRDFQRRTTSIVNEKFSAESEDSIRGGIQRCHFEECKLSQLISLAAQAGSGLAKRKKLIWEKRLLRKIEARHRFERLLAQRVPRPSFFLPFPSQAEFLESHYQAGADVSSTPPI